MTRPDLKLGFVAAAVDAPGTSDRELYDSMLRDIDAHLELGYAAAWMIEHHFSDYFPTPNPLVGLSHIAGRYPKLELGTAVLVTPWHNPLRLAEEMAMLSQLSSSHLHFGLGRGTAKFEYDAFGLDMAQARDRFREILTIVRRALEGAPFTFAGDHYTVDVPIRLRPEPRRDLMTLYGAIGSPSSAGLMGRYGIPPICTSIGDFDKQRTVIESWRAAAGEAGHPTQAELPIMINCIVGDTDEEAILEARTFMTRFMQAQVDHYRFDDAHLERVKGYEEWAAAAANFKRLTVPENIDGWTRYQLIGSPETVAARVRELRDIGFNHLIVHTATPGVPRDVRQRWATRFVRDVLPLLDVVPSIV